MSLHHISYGSTIQSADLEGEQLDNATKHLVAVWCTTGSHDIVRDSRSYSNSGQLQHTYM